MRIQIDPARVAKTFSPYADNPALQESAQLFAQGLPVAEMIQAMAMNGNVLGAFAAFDRIYPHGALERSLLEKVILRVSQLHQCQFCTESHTALMQQLNLPIDLSPGPAHTDRERLAIEYAENMIQDANRIPETLFERLHARFSDSEIVELTFLIGFITMLNLFNNALMVRYRGEFSKVQVR